MRRFHLYRHYDANGELLYVGQSNNAFKRHGEHKSESDWTALSVSMRIEHFDSRERVIAAERYAIQAENPAFNRCIRKRYIGVGEAVQVRLQPAPLAAVDDWRRKQPDLPGRAEAIRRLVEQALSASGKKR